MLAASSTGQCSQPVRLLRSAGGLTKAQHSMACHGKEVGDAPAGPALQWLLRLRSPAPHPSCPRCRRPGACVARSLAPAAPCKDGWVFGVGVEGLGELNVVGWAGCIRQLKGCRAGGVLCVTPAAVGM